MAIMTKCVLCGEEFEYSESLPFTDVCEKCLDEVWFKALAMPLYPMEAR